MSAATTDRQATQSGNTRLSLPVLADAVIPAGVMVAITAAGYATNAADTAGLRVMGVSTESVDATDESSGALTIDVSRDVYRMENSGDNALDLADVGQPCYVEDNQTVGTDPGSHSVLAGVVMEVDAGGVYVDFTATPLPALADLAAYTDPTTNGEIAALTSSATTTQGEFNALRDKCESLADSHRALIVKHNALLASLQAAGKGI